MDSRQGDNTLQKVLDTINGLGGAFHKSASKFSAERFTGRSGMRNRISYGSIL